MQTNNPDPLLKTADLCDDHSDNLQICYPLFNDYGGNITFQGKIKTLKCFEDNSLVREILGTPGEGQVLVVDAGGSNRCAMLGDLLAAKAVKNNWAGIIMNGYIRDSADISSMSLGVKALGVFPLKSVKNGLGEPDIPVRFAGVTFQTGEYVYADDDGIVVSATKLI